MRQRKQPRRERERTQVFVQAMREDDGSYRIRSFHVGDSGRYIGECNSTCKANVPSMATELVAERLGVPHGRIMISKLVYL